MAADFGNNYSYNAGGGGGGWLSATQGGGSQASPGSGSKGGSKANTLRPVTIKQILEASQSTPDGDFKIDDRDLTHITFCAQLLSISEQSAFNTYHVDDGTGSIDVKQWIDVDSSYANDVRSKLTEQSYVRVLGQLRVFSSKRMVAAHSIRPVQEYNEVIHHFLEATVVHLHFTRGPPEQFFSGGASGGDVVMGGTSGALAAWSGGEGGGDAAFAGLKPSERTVMRFLKMKGETDGVHINVIVQKTGLPITEVVKAKDKLMGLGHVYTTVDDETLAPVDF
ncbi:hypothetical protein BDZ91DRAFT_710600 [Kalaharituber pfeilii]|nr:hypothetical protein BDZ91DRAFT_710600 [Kalaharituber pfeilii]